MKRILSMLVVSCIIMSMAAQVVLADPTVVEVNNYDDLKTACETRYSGEAEGNPTIIKITGDIELLGQITIESKYKVFVSDGVAKRTISKGSGKFWIKRSYLRIGEFGDSGDNRLVFDGGNNSGSMFEVNEIDNAKYGIDVRSGVFQNFAGNIFYIFLGWSNSFVNFEKDVLFQNNTGLLVNVGDHSTSNRTFVITVNGAEFNNNTGGIMSARLISIIINGGTFKNCSRGGNGGLIYAKDGANIIINDGIFENCTSGDVGGVIFVQYEGGGNKTTATINGGRFVNCNGNYGNGAVAVGENAVLNVNGGWFKDCTQNAIMLEQNGILNLFGGTILDCSGAIWHKGNANSQFNMGGKVRISENSRISLNNDRKINIASDLTCKAGGLAVIDSKDTGTSVLTGLVSDNHAKFGVGSNRGVDSDGNVSTTGYPTFAPITYLVECDCDDVKPSLEWNDNDIAIAGLSEEAVLILASYAVSGSKPVMNNAAVIDVNADGTFDNNQLIQFLSEVPENSTVKAMLWNSTSNLVPLVAAETKPVN